MRPVPFSIRRRPFVAGCGVELVASFILVLCGAALGSGADESAESVPAAWQTDARVPARLAEPVLLSPIALETGAAGEGAPPSSLTPLADLRVAGFLAALFATVAFLKWGVRRSVRPLPSDVFAVLGEAPLGGPHVARIVRFGPKTILVGVSGGTCTPLAEIDDPVATERIARACGRSVAPPGSVSAEDRPAGLPGRPPHPRSVCNPVVAGTKEGA